VRAKFVWTKIAARGRSHIQIERVQRMPIRGDVQGLLQGASILLDVVDHFGPRLNKPLPAQELGGST